MTFYMVWPTPWPSNLLGESNLQYHYKISLDYVDKSCTKKYLLCKVSFKNKEDSIELVEDAF